MQDAIDKIGLGSITGLICYIIGCVNYLWLILIILVLFDYISGIVGAMIKNEKFDKTKAMVGAVQKVFYFMVIVTAAMCDYIAKDMGIPLPGNKLMSYVVVIYFIGTEGFSLLKNWGKIGLPLPGILHNFFGTITKEETTKELH